MCISRSRLTTLDIILVMFFGRVIVSLSFLLLDLDSYHFLQWSPQKNAKIFRSNGFFQLNPFFLRTIVSSSLYKLEFFTVRSGFLSFFEIVSTKKMSEYSDLMAEKLELI